MNQPRQKRRSGPWWFAAIALLAAGCATVGGGGFNPSTEIAAVATVEYYPFQVKGYQNSFPHRTMIVLLPVDSRDLKGPNNAPKDGRPAIGIVTDNNENIVERLYSDPVAPIVQQAIAHSSDEAGMHATPANQSQYVAGENKNADYVMATKVTKCWVKKHRGPDARFGPTWSTVADFALEVSLYKPPFSVPFWQGSINQEYFDPPIGSFGLGPDDEAGIYDDPGQVLSVAMTRAVAGIFQRDDLRMLVLGDHMAVR
jgi:hypothetical protein